MTLKRWTQADVPGYKVPAMTSTKPAFPAPDHDHGRCAADAIIHAERVCKERS